MLPTNTVQILKKELFVLSLLSVPYDLFWPDLPKSLAKISQEAREPEGLVKITHGFVASSLFKRAGNLNQEIFWIVPTNLFLN